MKYFSTNRRTEPASLRQAVLTGLADDGGLFMPDAIPALKHGFLEALPLLNFQEIAEEVSKPFLHDEVPEHIIHTIAKKAFDFDAPVKTVYNGISVLELFHGPTLAFKDFGARFMAQLLSYFLRNEDQELNILVATSGDTGSAVAYGFFQVPHIRVTILYPSGKVSEIQEKQLTTLGGNITALEVQGTFDDCQKLVKTAFTDKELRTKKLLGSANSINIARLIPQSFYYFSAYGQINPKLPLVFSVPSGNFGNLTAGVFAKKMGLPISQFIAATNVNNVVPEYLETGEFRARPSVQTISNAMDVGNPSNFHRLVELYNHDLHKIRADVLGTCITDSETRKAIRDVYKHHQYVLDPHGAVGYLALEQYLQNSPLAQGVFLETAHPAKFLDVVEEEIGKVVEIPKRLQECMHQEKQSIILPNSFEAFKGLLLG